MMNAYHSVFNTQDPQNNRNQFENNTSVVKSEPVNSDLVLKFLEVVSKDPVNEHKSSVEKLELAMQMIQTLKNS